MNTLTIHHDYDSGTTVEGTARNSPAHLALKEHGSWTWSRFAQAWLLRSSRHRQSKPHAIAEIERVLTALGYSVERAIDDTMPSVEQQEADLAERMDSRQDRLAERADTMAARAAGTRAAAEGCFPDNGQPLLIGHHSYRADRRRRERGHQLMGRAIEQHEQAENLARQAESTSHHMGARTSPVTVANRITTMEAEQRRLQRELAGTRELQTTDDARGPGARLVVRYPSDERAQFLQRQLADLAAKVEHWKGVYARLQAEGLASTVGPGTVAKGDWVLLRHGWARVRRVNKKSVTVPNPVFPAPQPGQYQDTWTVAWHKLRDHKTNEDMDPAFVDAYETPGVDRIALHSVHNCRHAVTRDRSGTTAPRTT